LNTRFFTYNVSTRIKCEYTQRKIIVIGFFTFFAFLFAAYSLALVCMQLLIYTALLYIEKEWSDERRRHFPLSLISNLLAELGTDSWKSERQWITDIRQPGTQNTHWQRHPTPPLRPSMDNRQPTTKQLVPSATTDIITYTRQLIANSRKLLNKKPKTLTPKKYSRSEKEAKCSSHARTTLFMVHWLKAWSWQWQRDNAITLYISLASIVQHCRLQNMSSTEISE